MFIEIPDHGTINTEEIEEVTKLRVYPGHKNYQYVIIMKSGKEHHIDNHFYPRDKLNELLLTPTRQSHEQAADHFKTDGEWEIFTSPATKDDPMFKKWQDAETPRYFKTGDIFGNYSPVYDLRPVRAIAG